MFFASLLLGSLATLAIATTTSDLVLVIAGAVGIAISLITTYFKPVATWYYTQVPEDKRGMVQVGLTLAVAILLFGLSCVNIAALVACTQTGAIELLKAWFVGLATNQFTYLTSADSKFKPVKTAKPDKTLILV